MRGDEKTTQLIHDAIELVSELPEDHHVFITGAHSRWLHELSIEFSNVGLEGIIFLSPMQILNGGLHGRKGILLIDDFEDLTLEQQVYLSFVRRHLYNRYRLDNVST